MLCSVEHQNHLFSRSDSENRTLGRVQVSDKPPRFSGNLALQKGSLSRNAHVGFSETGFAVIRSLIKMSSIP